jgi:hypothetical protein
VATTPAADASSRALTAAQASAQAKSTGRPVIADAMTTATSRTTANPNGSFTLDTSPSPVRVRKNGAWVGLDATLIRNGDGTYSPAATTGSLVLSGGGRKPLAVLTLGGRQLSLTLPTALPAPAVSGATATYSNVLPGIDLVVTATSQGGISDVFVVKTAAAAASPGLAALMKTGVSAIGLKVATDAAGNLAATDPGGRAVFTAPAATAWDSPTAAAHSAGAASGAAGPSSSSVTSSGLDPVSGAPLASSVNGPGERARTASLSASYAAGTLTLKPPSSLLTGAPHLPIYIDPPFGPSVSAWTMVNSAFPDQSYYGVGTNSRMQVGFNGWSAPFFTARSFTTLDLSGLPAGAVVSSAPNNAEVNFFEDVAPSCNASEVDLYQTGPIYGSGSQTTTWNNQPSWGASPIGTADVAHGYSGCAAAGVGFDLSKTVSSLVAGGGRSLTLGLRATAADEGNPNSGGNAYSWKQFNGDVPHETTTNASVTYDVPPNAPGGLRTNPFTTCAGSAVGDTGMTLYAQVSSPVGNYLYTTFNLYKTKDGSKTNLLTSANNVPSDVYAGPSGQLAVMTLPESFFKTLAGGAATSFTWLAQSTDGTLAGRWSNTCTFVWDPTRPGAPGIAPTANPPTGTVDCPLVPTMPTHPIGSACRFTISPPNGANISGYVYQVDDAAPVTVTAGGSADITVILPSIVNTLTVSALSAGGNVGSSSTVWFDGTTLNPPAADGDVNNDGTPDLIVPGQAGSVFPPGLWLATGHADGTTATHAVNVGTAGLFSTVPTATSPGEWNGAQAITGNFCGNGAQDVMAYFPGSYDASTNPHGGGGAIVCSNGDSSPLDVSDPVNGKQYTVTSSSIIDSVGNGATQVANAGNTSGADTGEPDLLATINNQIYLFDAGAPGTYTNNQTPSTACTLCDDLTTLNTPDGTQDWNSWTVTSAQDTRGGTTATDLYLWKPSTGDLYLWAGLGLPTGSAFPNATTLAYTQYQIATGWNTGKTLILRAADINRDGIPDLWVTDPSTGIATAYLLPALAASTQLSPSATTTLNTSDHAWLFQDIGTNQSGAQLTTTADSTGGLNLNGAGGTGNVVWNTGDLYSPDALLNTNSDGTVDAGGTGTLDASGSAVNVSSDFTVSVRARPAALGGVILSQDGVHSSGVTLYPDGSGKWYFCLAKTDSTTWNYDCASGGTVQLGLWSQITATYNHNTGLMTLYVNGVDVATASHAPVTGFGGNFHVGDYLYDNAPTAHYAGQVTDIQAWNQVVPPAQPQTAGSALVTVTPTRILDTRHGTGGTTGPIGPGVTVPLQITGTAGVPSTGVTAVALSVTATGATGNGHLTVYPDGTAQPDTSAVNFPTGNAVTNGVIVPVGANGKIDINNSLNTGTGSDQIIADITGYFTTDTDATGASDYNPITPVRALDTRNGTGAPKAQIGGGKSLQVAIAGTNGVPAAGVTAVAINLTAVDEVTGGPLIAYPDGIATPTTTAVSFNTNEPTAAMSILPLGSDGKIDLYNASGGATDAIGDIVGYYTTAATSGPNAQMYHPLDSTRLLDTRLLSKPVASYSAYPYQQSVVSAVNPTLVVNITATQETVGGLLTLVPGDFASYTQPPTSTLNYASLSIANLDLAQTTNNYFTLFNNSAGTTHLIIDTNGYFAGY